MYHQLLYTLICGLCITAIGCGTDGPERVPLSGVVTYKGEPLAGASVTFQPLATGKTTAPGIASMGTTDQDGRFSLRTINRENTPGAVPGPNAITITTVQDFGASTNAPEDDLEASETTSAVPAEPAWTGTFEVQYTVPKEGTSEANFEVAP
ncbi:DUF4198 domain-containing protein [Calycomorphotria hydatis]|nr:DUF4198 domain-containing protein [Calycomorphotria hydatis]